MAANSIFQELDKPKKLEKTIVNSNKSACPSVKCFFNFIYLAGQIEEIKFEIKKFQRGFKEKKNLKL